MTNRTARRHQRAAQAVAVMRCRRQAGWVMARVVAMAATVLAPMEAAAREAESKAAAGRAEVASAGEQAASAGRRVAESEAAAVAAAELGVGTKDDASTFSDAEVPEC